MSMEDTTDMSANDIKIMARCLANYKHVMQVISDNAPKLFDQIIDG